MVLALIPAQLAELRHHELLFDTLAPVPLAAAGEGSWFALPLQDSLNAIDFPADQKHSTHNKKAHHIAHLLTRSGSGAGRPLLAGPISFCSGKEPDSYPILGHLPQGTFFHIQPQPCRD